MSSNASPSGRKLVLSTLLETDHYESLIKELTCTKCSRYMKPPIHLCVDGHSICGPCYEKSYQCHICKKEFSQIRPAVLESLANKVLFPCTNSGCPKHATLTNLENHTPNCQFRIISCFMARVYGDCKWEGRAGEWMDHCFAEHKQRVTELPFITVKDRWDAKRTEPVLNYFLMRCFEKVYNVYQIYDKRGVSVQHKTGTSWYNQFGNFDVKDEPHSDRHVADKVDAALEKVEPDRHISSFYIAEELGIDHNTDRPIVRKFGWRPCKNEKDADFLEHTQNVYIPVENIFSMLDESESLNFTIRIGEVENLPLLDTPSESESMILLHNEEHKDDRR
ncbi:E3 ubiquitin-protein ligase Siah1 [Eumeta japonica]|uniref:RING-type E3 ubiquitin transferase n=1 Tax=Eumeta variegata TaxID=151549 RepID=A0A4C1VQZ1_EUMVA|nr:E3 ubiquitin-protein ligase Siah1 [Eumeta japonica]